MSNGSEAAPDTVQVALRIRPLVESEVTRGCDTCLQTFREQQQVQVKGLAFTYNYVFPPEVGQRTFYSTAVAGMVTKLFKGYNVTILAYGQTGSGKTYSMGTCYSGSPTDTYEAGIIPQAVGDIFDYVDSNSEEFDFKISVSFMELYQEQLFDLLSTKPREQNAIDIREDNKEIVLPGLTEEQVCTAAQTMDCLVRGSAGRATGATAMNATSSRSHAIFTMQIVKESKLDKNQITTSKFHLVDLAGSERSKKTKATGNRFKEGVKINQGLLALGNVISALGDGTTRGFICYRESKLTRLLQDSLGGNSITLMIACVSPADYNLDETISTLRYADRAKQIRNKPIINQDAKGAEIIRLNNMVQQLRLQLLNGGGGFSEDTSQLSEELKREKMKNVQLTDKYEIVLDKNKNLNRMLQEALTENTNIFEKIILAEAAKEKVDQKLTEITEECNQTIDNLQKVSETSSREEVIQSMCEMRRQIIDLHSEQRQCGQLIQQMIVDDDDSKGGDSEGVGEDFVEGTPDLNESEINEKEEAHALEQVSRNHQLQDLVKSLALKISLAEKLSANNLDLNTHNQNVRDYEQRITELEEEREKLVGQLKVNHLKPKLDSKGTEERRGRIQSLEAEISNLKKKCTQQACFIKMKEKNDLKIVSLNKEIIQMKANKVKLIKTMQQENTRFRSWKVQSERKMAKLCDQDRKRQNAMVKMEIKHVKTQNVLKRKMEEAVAINKRLKEVLDRQKTAQKQRSVPSRTDSGKGSPEGVLQWVEQELEVVKWLVAAERHLEGLMEDRQAFTTQLKQARAADPRNPCIPRLQEEVAQRSAQIAELQEKILTGDQDNKVKSRWDSLQTMAEAKNALKYLFEVAVETKREAQGYRYKTIQEDNKFEELLSVHEENLKKLNELEHKLLEINLEHKKGLSEIERQNEERICTLLRQLNGTDISTPNDQLMERINILEEVSQRVIKAKNELEKENEELNLQLKFRKAKKAKFTAKSLDRKSASFFSDNEDYEDSDEDPDWIATPRVIKTRSILKEVNPPPAVVKSAPPVKRTSDGQTKCTCKGSCSTKQCSCRKLGLACGSRCKCSQTCVNKDISDTENQSSGANTLDSITEPDDEPLSKIPMFRRENSEESDKTDLTLANKKKNRSFFYGEGRSEL